MNAASFFFGIGPELSRVWDEAIAWKYDPRLRFPQPRPRPKAGWPAPDGPDGPDFSRQSDFIASGLAPAPITHRLNWIITGLAYQFCEIVGLKWRDIIHFKPRPRLCLQWMLPAPAPAPAPAPIPTGTESLSGLARAGCVGPASCGLAEVFLPRSRPILMELVIPDRPPVARQPRFPGSGLVIADRPRYRITRRVIGGESGDRYWRELAEDIAARLPTLFTRPRPDIKRKVKHSATGARHWKYVSVSIPDFDDSGIRWLLATTGAPLDGTKCKLGKRAERAEAVGLGWGAKHDKFPEHFGQNPDTLAMAQAIHSPSPGPLASTIEREQLEFARHGLARILEIVTSRLNDGMTSHARAIAAALEVDLPTARRIERAFAK